MLFNRLVYRIIRFLPSVGMTIHLVVQRGREERQAGEELQYIKLIESACRSSLPPRKTRKQCHPERQRRIALSYQEFQWFIIHSRYSFCLIR
jgi:hypothetical protein